MDSAWTRNLYLFALLFLGGCAAAPETLERGHQAYNAAVKQAGDTELLLNIVRLRYADTMDFMSTNSVSSQVSFSVSVGDQAGTIAEGDIGLGQAEIAYSSRPTFTFRPQRGQEFAAQLVRPADLEILTYLVAADWDLNLLLRLLARGLNDLDNEVGLPNPRFREVATALGALQTRNEVFVGFIEDMAVLSAPIAAERVSGTDLVEAARSGFHFRRESPGGPFVLTTIRPRPVMLLESGNAEADTVRRLLGLKTNGRGMYTLRAGTRAGLPEAEQDSITIRTRSLLGATVYLSQGVEVPEEHIALDLATREWPPGNTAIDIGDLFRLHHSTTRPDARLAAQHRGYWFYLSDTDFASRYAFFTLAELVGLGLSQTPAQAAPVLTLPVGGP